MIDRISHFLSLACRIISGASIVSMAVIAFLDSIGRPLGHPVPGASECVSFALMLFFFSSLPLVVKDDAQIRVGLLSDFYGPRLSTFERRVTSAAETLGLATVAWMIFDQASRLSRFGTQSVYFELPVTHFVSTAFVFSLFAVWFAFANFRQSKLRGLLRDHANPGKVGK